MKKTQGFRIGMKVSVFSQLSLAALHRFSSAAALPRLPSSSSSAAASVAMSNSHDSAAAASSSSSSSSSLQQTNKRLRKGQRKHRKAGSFEYRSVTFFFCSSSLVSSDE
jgi:hypothetical protein